VGCWEGRGAEVTLVAKQVRIFVGGENWLQKTVLQQSCLLMKEKTIIFRAIGGVLAFRQKSMRNEDLINTSFKI